MHGRIPFSCLVLVEGALYPGARLGPPPLPLRSRSSRSSILACARALRCLYVVSCKSTEKALVFHFQFFSCHSMASAHIRQLFLCSRACPCSFICPVRVTKTFGVQGFKPNNFGLLWTSS